MCLVEVHRHSKNGVAGYGYATARVTMIGGTLKLGYVLRWCCAYLNPGLFFSLLTLQSYKHSQSAATIMMGVVQDARFNVQDTNFSKICKRFKWAEMKVAPFSFTLPIIYANFAQGK